MINKTHQKQEQNEIPWKATASDVWARQEHASADENGPTDEAKPVMFDKKAFETIAKEDKHEWRIL